MPSYGLPHAPSWASGTSAGCAEAAPVRRPIVLLRQVRVPESGAPLQGATSADDQICFLGDEGSLVSLWLHGGFMV